VKSGVKENHVNVDSGALNKLIKFYCRESGVRNLQKQIEKIFRKAAFKLVSDGNPDTQVINVNEENLNEFVGKPVFTSERMYDQTPAGVVMGLAWTSMGGSALYIETTLEKKLDTNPDSKDQHGSIHITGNLGNVMKESIQIAYTFAKSYLIKIDPQNVFLQRAHLHVHVPEVKI
jgi:ATP-dependent Lon protease